MPLPSLTSLPQLIVQSGQERSVKIQEVRPRNRRGKPRALDSQGNEFMTDMNVKVVEGPYKGREGKVRVCFFPLPSSCNGGGRTVFLGVSCSARAAPELTSPPFCFRSNISFRALPLCASATLWTTTASSSAAPGISWLLAAKPLAAPVLCLSRRASVRARGKAGGAAGVTAPYN